MQRKVNADCQLAYMVVRTLIIGLAVVGFIGCAKDKDKNNDNVYSSWPIIKVDGATRCTINQSIPITVSWPFTSGCDLVDKFAESSNGNTLTITTLGYTVKAYCTMDAGVKTIVYNFKPTKAGVYELKFVNNDSFIPHVVTIN
jgi:hypothetical protein